MKRICVLILLAILMFGCTTPAKNIKDSQSLRKDQGILVTTLHSNWKGYERLLPDKLLLTYCKREKHDIYYEGMTMDRADDFKVIAISAGQYKWRGMNTVNVDWWFSDRSGFEIEAGKVTYIGDIFCEIRGLRAKILVEDREKETLERLRATYPRLLDAYPFKKQLTFIEPT